MQKTSQSADPVHLFAPWDPERKITDYSPDPDSPNGLWRQLGYTVERSYFQGRAAARTIRRPDGTVVDIGEGPYDQHFLETKAAVKEGARLTNAKNIEDLCASHRNT